MNQDKLNTLDQVLAGLMRRYMDRVPEVARVLEAMIQNKLIDKVSDIENDHIAFRTMGVPNLGIQSLEKIFLHYGYTKRDHYFFEGKKLDAYWYSPPEDKYPRIFMSELRVGDLSQRAQQIIHKYTDTVKTDPVSKLNLDDWQTVDQFLHTGLWPVPSLKDYEALLEESEYAAWVIYNRYYLNHFTISIHSLPDARYRTMEQFVNFLVASQIRMNTAGGLIKVSPDGKLKQSSTVASKVLANFQDDEQLEIPGSYVEFAERLVLEEYKDLPASQITRKHRRDGFETGNADRIFESTFREQTDKK